MKQKESAKPNKQRKASAKAPPKELSSSDLSCSMCNRHRLVSSNMLEHTNNNTSHIRLGLVIVSNDRWMMTDLYQTPQNAVSDQGLFTVCHTYSNILDMSTGSRMDYSRLSLSRPRLSWITAYLEVKIWSLFKHENLTTGKKILWKRGEIAPKEQFLLFSTILSIYL